MSNRDSIKVVCRVRPLNQIELNGNFQICVNHDNTSISVNVSYHIKYKISLQTELDAKAGESTTTHSFTFDRVFGQ